MQSNSTKEIKASDSDTDKAADAQYWQQVQEQHYDKLAGLYQSHYSDQTSERYRRKFIDEPMLAGVELKGKKVLEAMCGSGQTTGYLLEQGAEVTGLDLSPNLVESFKQRWPGCEAHCTSIYQTGIADQSFDVVVIVGGLHHLHPDIDTAMLEVHRLLKPGGMFCVMEPHTGSFPDKVRRLWYKFDPYFESNEEAVDFEALTSKHEDLFKPKKIEYIGNFGYLLILNSMIFRLPLSWKKYYAPVLMVVESIFSPLQTKFLSCIALAQWCKK